MKFGKLLKSWAEEEMPNQSDLFLRFKELKKQLKLIKPAETGIISADGENAVLLDMPADREDPNVTQSRDGQAAAAPVKVPSSEETQFLRTLEEDLHKFNDFFIDKEEDFIIQMGVLEERLEQETDAVQLRKIRRGFMDVHGSMILLINWSMLNFTAVVKILKKHDKCSATVLRKPLLASLLQQPFNSTERVSELIRTAEKRCKELLEKGGADAQEIDGKMLQEQAEMSRQTKAALGLWENMSKTASTPSTVLPLNTASHPQSSKNSVPDSTEEEEPSTKRARNS